MTTTTDLQDFGFRELRLAAELLATYCECPPSWLGRGVHLMMNPMSGNVFLTDEDCNVAMMNGSALDAWLFTPHDGLEGFIDELTEQYNPDHLHADDEAYIRHWADELGFYLPKAWRRE
ncbi:MAG: hypothetical protein IKE66_10675 [Hyphomicrobium sp.]|nr:hypothetical protein [Hyphomicrobium sp.]